MSRTSDTGFHGSPEMMYKAYLNTMEKAVSLKKLELEEKLLIQTFISEVAAIRQITNHRRYGISAGRL